MLVCYVCMCSYVCMCGGYVCMCRGDYIMCVCMRYCGVRVERGLRIKEKNKVSASQLRLALTVELLIT